METTPQMRSMCQLMCQLIPEALMPPIVVGEDKVGCDSLLYDWAIADLRYDQHQNLYQPVHELLPITKLKNRTLIASLSGSVLQLNLLSLPLSVISPPSPWVGGLPSWPCCWDDARPPVVPWLE
jgi:hypothetical protein